MSGGGGLKKTVVDTLIHKPVQVYLGGAAFVYAVRQYQTQTTFNYWFGKAEFERRLAKGTI